MSVIEEIRNHINLGHNFLLSGGAGSGKTYTLVEVLRGIIEDYPSKHVACITYTNTAVDEIKNRVNHPNVSVSTIHDFLWANICNYQQQLKSLLPELINNPDCKISMRGVEYVEDDYFFGHDIERIDYKEYLKINEGVISHDEVLIIAKAMFEKYPKLREVVSWRNPFIMVDEYQDTHQQVVDIMLEFLSPKVKEKEKHYSLIGFFGDSMQSIYDDGVGNIDNYVMREGHDDGHVYEVKLEQNRRNPKNVIELANKLRTDRIVQEPSKDKNAPNMKDDGSVKDGIIKFLYSKNEGYSLEQVHKRIEKDYQWDFRDTKETKELDLTYNLIAARGGFPHLNQIFDGDPILGYRDKIRDFIKGKKYERSLEGKTFGEVVEMLKSDYSSEVGKLAPTTSQEAFIDDNIQWFELAKNTNYEQFCKMYVERQQLIDDKKQSEEEKSKRGSKRSTLVKHLCKIEYVMECYKQGNLGEFFRLSERKYIRKASEKVDLSTDMSALEASFSKKIIDVIETANEKGIVYVDDKLKDYQERYSYIYERVAALPYSEFKAVYDYLEGRTPYSTQHKTKGAEYDRVLVLMDNGSWRNYNYVHLMAGTPPKKSTGPEERTKKLFYVCCTRAKEELIVFFPTPTNEVLETAKDWFGGKNVIPID